MKLFTLLTLLLITKTIQAQGWFTYLSDAFIFELLEQHAPLEEFFGKRDSSFTIEQYYFDYKTDSLTLGGGTVFSFLDNRVIKVHGFNYKMKLEKPTYWKLTTNKKGTRSIYPVECNKKGKLKRYNDFKTYTYRKFQKDSTIEEIAWRVNRKGDTAAHMLSKWVYSKDTLKEFWQGTVLDNKATWESQEIYSINRYSYPRSNVTLTERLLILRGQIDTLGTMEINKSYNNFGRLSSITQTFSNQTDKLEERYFYKNGKWEKTESWQGSKLYEVIKKNHR